MNIEAARINMLTQQIRTWDVLDSQVLDAIKATPREYFVPTDYQDLAFADMNIPLAHKQVMLTPGEEGRLVQSLNIQASDEILEIGTGSAYTTAILARLGKHIYSIDIFAEFTEQAQRKLAAINVSNVSLTTADASHGWEQHGPYDVIAITGSLPYLPDNFRHSLKPGGRLFVVLGQAPVMKATLITYHGNNEWTEEKIFETVVPPLINAPTISSFSF